jgi:threonylcarbamoyladenosine tRNA methylthiotransferase MtaB
VKVSFHTLGCKVNFAETSTLAREFAAAGFERVGSSVDDEEGADTHRRKTPPTADIYVVNSCTVTAAADKKCRNLIARLHRHAPDAKIIVTGCYAQRDPDRVSALRGVWRVIGNGDKGKVVGAARGIHTVFDFQIPAVDLYPAYSVGDRTRSFLKVQDGCDYQCSYCTIHSARGMSRSLPISQVVRHACEIARSGVKEIVITGVNTGDFGRSTGESFIDLLRALDGVEGIERYRISSIEPNLLTDAIIDFCASSEKFQPHFHIPLQSGSDRILGLMRRRYTTAQFAERIERVRARMPDAFIGVDVIVGFPGETEQDFEATRDFLERIAPAQLHVFPYSSRPDTPAAEMRGRVAPEVAAARAAQLGELSRRLHDRFTIRFSGTQAMVLWEAALKGGMMSGFTVNYLKITAPYDHDKINTITETILI